jgi:predicted ATPase with chaperone activity
MKTTTFAVEAPLAPPIPETIDETGVSAALIEQLILKTLYYRSETLGRDLALSLGLKFSVIEETVDFLKRQHLVQVRRSMGMGNISAVYALTEAGRQHAREYLEACQYAGRVPVPLEQYAAMVRQQRQPENWLTMEMLEQAYQHMVVSPELLSAIGPAVSSGKSFLIYGQPGNGKTYLAEALFKIDPTPIYIPYAIEAQGMIIQVFDPIYHQPHTNDEDGNSPLAFAFEPSYDQRWMSVRRPFIVSGGELDLAMLDLSYNEVAKFYDAPLQLKANNGIYLIDDFGRQKVTPAEVLNRWIVPMERRVDYLTFKNGTKMHVPFETFLIFSTNLKPAQLGDEAFLRRIQYKMLLRSPDKQEFLEIFERFAGQNRLPYERQVVEEFLERRWVRAGKPFRRCQARDVLTHAMDLIHFEHRPWQLTAEVLELAFESNFVDTTEDN